MQTTTQLRNKIRLVSTRHREHELTVDVQIKANCALDEHVVADIADAFDAKRLRLADWRVKAEK